MSFTSRHNKGSIFNCNTEGFEYLNPGDLFKKDPTTIYTLQGLYINKKSKYGNAPVAICDSFFVNFPSHMLDECIEILTSEEDINDIKAGKVGFSIYEYETEDFPDKTFYGIRWEDVN